jgi:hypothetical protein
MLENEESAPYLLDAAIAVTTSYLHLFSVPPSKAAKSMRPQMHQPHRLFSIEISHAYLAPSPPATEYIPTDPRPPIRFLSF